MIDRRPNGGEIEPQPAADIAIGDIAGMQRQTETEGCQFAFDALKIERGDTHPRLACRRQRIAAAWAQFTPVGRKYR